MRTLLIFNLIVLAIGLILGGMGESSVQGKLVLEHQRLQIRNTYKNPEEVVAYYCARDASGFVWSGMLDAERRAFTLWDQAPEQDSFYIAKTYEIGRGMIHADEAVVDVTYDVLAIGDAHGTRMPPVAPQYLVSFELKRVAGVWKIAKPDPQTLAPVVLEAKFPFASTH
ncbi:MAG: hypothetical protein ACXWPM_10400 [Bdellovibrionota bacterium]